MSNNSSREEEDLEEATGGALCGREMLRLAPVPCTAAAPGCSEEAEERVPHCSSELPRNGPLDRLAALGCTWLH